MAEDNAVEPRNIYDWFQYFSQQFILINKKLNVLTDAVAQLMKLEGLEMSTLDEVVAKDQSILAEVQVIAGGVGQVVSLVGDLGTQVAALKQQLADALAQAGTITPELQAKIDQVSNDLDNTLGQLQTVGNQLQGVMPPAATPNAKKKK